MPDTKWFQDCGWGVFCHYLADPPKGADSEPEPKVNTPESWNAQVDAFDVGGLANQLESAGAGYLFITLTQGSGYFCSPSAVYDRITGVSPSKCSRRDLIADLYSELDRRGIKLLVYSPSDFSFMDAEARKGLKLFHHHRDYWPPRREVWHEHRQVDFMRNVEAILSDYAGRWGRNIAGWWIDGCYEAEHRFPENDPPNFETLAAALRTGNPDAIVAFNTGIKIPLVRNTVHEDYTSGEIARAFPECPGPAVDLEGHTAQYHLLSFLGRDWCHGEPRFPDEFVAGYTKHVIRKGGVISWDVPIKENGLIPQPFIRQLKAISNSLR